MIELASAGLDDFEVCLPFYCTDEHVGPNLKLYVVTAVHFSLIVQLGIEYTALILVSFETSDQRGRIFDVVSRFLAALFRQFREDPVYAHLHRYHQEEQHPHH